MLFAKWIRNGILSRLSEMVIDGNFCLSSEIKYTKKEQQTMILFLNKQNSLV